MRLSRFLTLLLLSLSPALGAEPTATAAPARAWTLAELSALALEQHPDTRVAWASLAQSQAAERIARAGWWPTLSASYGAQRSRSLGSEGSEVPMQNRYGPALSLSWLLFDFGTRSGSIDRAAAERLAAEYSLNQTLQDRVLVVETAYYDALGSAALAAAEQRALDAALANQQAAQTRHRAGLATIAEVYQVEAARAAAELALAQAQGRARIAQGTLAAAVGFAPDTPLLLADWHPQPDEASLPATPLADLLQQARSARPELLAAIAGEQAAAAAARAARGAALPSLRGTASAGRTTVTDRGTSETYSVGATLSAPLFAGGALRAAMAQARAAQTAAQASTASLRLNIEQQVWTAYRNVETAHSSLAAADSQFIAAERSAEAIRARYRNGLSSVLELLSVESALARARVDQIQAGLDWSLALATLAHDAGGLAAARPEAPSTDEAPAGVLP